MKAIRAHTRGGPETLVVEDAPVPIPAEGEVRIRVHAAAVTPSEFQWELTWVTRTGEPRTPVVPGHEFSGEIDAVGPGVAHLARGDAVYGMNDWYRDGGQAELCIARTDEIAAKPRTIDHVAAAVTPISALTAWQGLTERARLRAGERVLIHGAAGGVGMFAVQLARHLGAHVIATASGRNLDFVRELGAAEVLDYRGAPFEQAVGKVDVVFDAVGGETLDRSWSVLAPHGRLVTIAGSSETTTDARVHDAFFIVRADATQLAEVARRIDAGELRAIVGAVFSLEEGRRAYEEKPERGKNVLRIAR